MSTEEIISIEGTLLMLDDATPHVAVPVQVICNGEVIATTLSNEKGRYQFTKLSPGSYQLRCHVLGGYVYYQSTGDTLRKTVYGSQAMARDAGQSLYVENGKTIRNINLHFAPFKKGTWRTITHFDGLANNHILVVHQDFDGMMWFGTRGRGISRYDGREFTNLTIKDGLPNNYVFSIAQARDGTMWFGGVGSISRYDGREFVNFDIEGLVHAICIASDGIVWCGTWGNGVSYHDGKEFGKLTAKDGLAGDLVSAIHQDSSGTMWFGTDGGVSRYDGKEFTNFIRSLATSATDGLVHDSVHSIYGEPNGVLWFGTDGGVSRHDGKEFVNLTPEDGLLHGIVSSIHRDADGTMWFGTGFGTGDLSGAGVSRYDGRGFVNFTTKDGLAHNTVHSIHRDPNGILWFGTDGGGVSRYDERGVVNLTTKDGLAHDYIWTIYDELDGDLWFGTDGGGVSRYDGESVVTLTSKDGLPDDHIFSILRDAQGAFWFGTDKGVSRYDGKSFVNLPRSLATSATDGLANDHVFCMHQAPDGTIWFGTQGGVSRYNGRELINFTTEDGLAGNWVYSIYGAPDGVMWFCTLAGVSQYDGKEFSNLTFEEGLPSNIVPSLHRDRDGTFWFGTLAGVSRYDGKEFVNLTTEDGLAYNYVYDIYRDRDGTIWFATGGGGVSRYDGVAWASLDARDGLTDNTVWAIHQDQNGVLWFGTAAGLTCYSQNGTSPKARIVSVRIGEKEYANLEAIPAIVVGNHVTVKYSSIDFKTVPEKRQYRCRIKELDPDWRRPSRESQFEWMPEKAGVYTFEVQAIDRDLNYSEPVALSLTVQPDPVLVSLQTELDHLRHEMGKKYEFQNIIGTSLAIMKVRALMERAIDSELTVLITGETGTGKELVAWAIHHNSSRKGQPWLPFSCGEVPGDLLASKLFGHRKGAFTGAHEDQMGLFEAASGGTIVLDEIGEMSKDMQVQLLRVLAERKIQRLGEHISRDVDVRIIAMTNRDLVQEVTTGRFREDLFYRLNEFPIHMPPLRERREDIPLLAEHFLNDYLQEHNRKLDGFASDVFDMLQSYSWPGNVRELRNESHRACALAEPGSQVQTYHFSSQITRGESLVREIMSERVSYRESLNRFGRRLAEEALRECNGNRTHAARLLGMDRSNLVALIKRLGIKA